MIDMYDSSDVFNALMRGETVYAHEIAYPESAQWGYHFLSTVSDIKIQQEDLVPNSRIIDESLHQESMDLVITGDTAIAVDKQTYYEQFCSQQPNDVWVEELYES